MLLSSPQTRIYIVLFTLLTSSWGFLSALSWEYWPGIHSSLLNTRIADNYLSCFQLRNLALWFWNTIDLVWGPWILLPPRYPSVFTVNDVLLEVGRVAVSCLVIILWRSVLCLWWLVDPWVLKAFVHLGRQTPLGLWFVAVGLSFSELSFLNMCKQLAVLLEQRHHVLGSNIHAMVQIPLPYIPSKFLCWNFWPRRWLY